MDTHEPDVPRQTIVAPLACMVYKKQVVINVKNSKVSY